MCGDVSLCLTLIVDCGINIFQFFILLYVTALQLAAAGVSVNGSIVIVRYGHIYRGNKVSSAQTRGAVAVIIYSDPDNEGSTSGIVYPGGPWRPASGACRDDGV